MLQIVTGMYFRDVPLNETVHRSVLYTNASALFRAPLELPVGRFSFATGASPVNAVTIEATERLEATRPDGSNEFHIATGGTELIDDAADVFAFAVNVSCSRNAGLLRQLVPPRLDRGPNSGPSSVLRQTFDPAVFLGDEALEAAHSFATKLLLLRRDHFEVAMRSIRSVVDASLLVNDDPGLAYTLFVASLESLAQFSIPAQEVTSWKTYDSRRRKILDTAVADADLDDAQAETIRQAVLKADQLSLRRRYVDFVLGHIEPAYFRHEATEAIRPIRAHDLPHALDVAYRLRSRNVHVLEALAPELWAIADRADTLRWESRSVLSLEGLNRLSRHVIARFVDRAPTELDATFQYRDHLPGIVKVQIAPQYWIWQAEGFSVKRAPQVLEGFLDLLLETIADPDRSQLVDLTAVLERIEAELPLAKRAADREPMVAIYVLWHAVMNSTHDRPDHSRIIDQYRGDLDKPTPTGFAVRLFASSDVEWDLGEKVQLVEQRREELLRGRGQPLPARIDAALLLDVADALWEAGRRDESLALFSAAVETVPGDEALATIEKAALDGERPTVDLIEFVSGYPGQGESPDAVD